MRGAPLPLGRCRQLVEECIAAHGARGATYEDVRRFLSEHRFAVRQTMSALAKDGRIVATGEWRAGVTGYRRKVFIVPDSDARSVLGVSGRKP